MQVLTLTTVSCCSASVTTHALTVFLPGSITLLFQDMAGGLQVRSPNGNFVNATPIEDTIVVNAADLLARWSNDTIKSTKHRVVEPPKPAEKDWHPSRYSIAYFCNPNL